MSLLEAIVLGLLQGLTEFLPISSSAHLLVFPALFGWDDPGAAFTAVTQLGTETAVLIYFRHELWAIATTWLGSLRDPELRRRPEARLGWYIIIATVPIVILGLTFETQIENGARNLWLVGSMLIVFGLVLLYADRRAKLERDIDGLSTRDGILIGLAQCLSLIPGVSRSGATISAGLLLGLDRAAAARFAFLLALPAVFGSGLYQLLDILRGEEAVGEPIAMIALATVVAFVVGYAVIAGLLRYLQNHTLGVFVGYRIALGILVLALTAAGAISV
ncbi:undecaprenyl-diphosphate phosphatase [Thermoleophilia bacterium SCSIO 60948]|nr:undecaprenyl-diphosphate phosphatase [Thermoleophilia bacterium SCSIO 60948]